jgi:hypothetical protein
MISVRKETYIEYGYYIENYNICIFSVKNYFYYIKSLYKDYGVICAIKDAYNMSWYKLKTIKSVRIDKDYF